MIHTESCKQRHANQQAWQLQWPAYCRHCDATGLVLHEHDPSPSGISLSPGVLVDGDPCSHCIEQGKCPRCNHTHDGDDHPCSECGWNWGGNMDDYRPEWECWCDVADSDIEEYNL